MAEDHSQRPFRSSEPRASGSGSSSGSDPLAELARLIGQTDPFSEFGRDNARRPAPRATPQAAPPVEFPPRPAETIARVPGGRSDRDFHAPPQPAPYSEPELPLPEVPVYGRQTYGGAPLATGNDLYQMEPPQGAYQEAADAAYETEPYPQHGAIPQGGYQDTYDDVPPSKRRAGIVVIAGVFALAVVGTAGAFGYRAIFGSSGSSGPPPVIKAETAPSKIVPTAVANKDPNKLINDRVGDGSERLVSRQETPVDVRDRVANSAFPPPQAALQSNAQAPLGSGVVGPEPKRVRTIAITPDQPGAAAQANANGNANMMPAPAPPPSTASAPPRVVNITPARPNAQPVAEPEPAARQPAARPNPPPQQQAAAADNAPLSLSPNAAPPRAAAPPARTAAAPTSLAPAAAPAATGGFAVQLTSQRSEAEAQAAFRSLQGRYPAQLGNQQAMIRRVDLGDKGVYYRAMVGPFANGSDATGLCSSLKAAGGQCIVQKN